MTYASQTATEQQQKEAAQRDARNREVFDEVLSPYPVKDHEANFRLFVDWSGDGTLTLEKAEYLIKRKPVGFNIDATTREALISELGDFLRETTSERTLSAHDFRNFMFRAGTWSLRQIRAYKKELLLKRELTTVQKARNYLTEARGTEETKYPGFPKLLKQIVPAGEIFARDTRTYLLELAKTDIFTFKKFARIYSQQQINDILNQ